MGTLESTRQTYEDFDWEGQDCELELEAAYRIRDGDLELEVIDVLGALVGPDRREASPDEIKRMQTALRRDAKACARIWGWVIEEVEV